MTEEIKNRTEELERELWDLRSELDSTWSDCGDWRMAKGFENLIITMKDATAINFVSKFISWLTTTMTELTEVIALRVEKRTRIEEILAELETLKSEDDSSQS